MHGCTGIKFFIFTFCLLPLNFACAQLRVLETRHYRIHTDLDAALAEELAARMDAMHGEYSRRLADFRAANARKRFEVYLFARRADYLNFVGEEFTNSGGLFMPRRNLLVAFLQEQGRDGLRRTLQHEAFHQFAFVAIHPNLPVWLNEGIAQLFEEGIWDGQRFWMGQVPPRRLRQLRADFQAKRLTDFRTFMNLPHEQWADQLAGSADAGATQYNQAWAMIHFLAFDERHGQPVYRQRLVKLLKLLHEGNSAEEAFAQAFSDNIDGFEDRFVEYARRLQATPQATLIEHQDILSDMLTELSRHGKTFVNVDAFRKEIIEGQYRIQYTKGQIQWRTEDDPAAYFRDADGQWLGARHLYFQRRPGAPLPDIVRRLDDGTQFRACFYQDGARIEHEVVVESAGK